jgi:hypothetical protein
MTIVANCHVPRVTSITMKGERNDFPFSDSIPILPLFNAGQMMVVQVEYLDF